MYTRSVHFFEVRAGAEERTHVGSHARVTHSHVSQTCTSARVARFGLKRHRQKSTEEIRETKRTIFFDKILGWWRAKWDADWWGNSSFYPQNRLKAEPDWEGERKTQRHWLRKQRRKPQGERREEMLALLLYTWQYRKIRTISFLSQSYSFLLHWGEKRNPFEKLKKTGATICQLLYFLFQLRDVQLFIFDWMTRLWIWIDKSNRI